MIQQIGNDNIWRTCKVRVFEGVSSIIGAGSRAKTRRSLRKFAGILGAASMLLLLASCARLDPLYCEEEGRAIPEDEWKARAMLVLWKREKLPLAERRAWGEWELPSGMKLEIDKKLSRGGNDSQLQKILVEYVQENPSCCEVDYDDEEGFIDMAREVDNGPPTKYGTSIWEVDPVATLYLNRGYDAYDIIKYFITFDHKSEEYTYFLVDSCGNKVK